MTPVSFLLLLLVAAIAGGLGQILGGGMGGGCLVDIGVGFLGAWVGTWIASAFGLPTFFVVDAGGVDFPVVWAIIGGGAVVAVLGLVFAPARRV